jgi:phosphoribosylanthranilate isomerase
MALAKVCGITTRDDLAVAVEAGAAAVGFVVDVDVGTPREIDGALAAELAAATPPFVTATLVTIPDSAAGAAELGADVGADAIQVHGLTAPEVAAVGDAFAGDVVAAVDHDADIECYADAGDALLLDSLDAADAGGTGETHDWDRSHAVVERLDVPVVLAGGLAPGNVRAAVETVGPYAVDVASGVERAGGLKDPEAVRAFVARARSAVAGDAAEDRAREVDA